MQQCKIETGSMKHAERKEEVRKLIKRINTREERIARGGAGPSYPGNPPLNLRP
jgi:coenzyme F420-reducing hydrogenase delta subunit